MGFQAKILANKLNTLFKLLFWPRVIGAIIGTLLGLGAVAFLGLAGLAINLAGSVVAYFIYAKMMEKTSANIIPRAKPAVFRQSSKCRFSENHLALVVLLSAITGGFFVYKPNKRPRRSQWSKILRNNQVMARNPLFPRKN